MCKIHFLYYPLDIKSVQIYKLLKKYNLDNVGLYSFVIIKVQNNPHILQEVRERKREENLKSHIYIYIL